MSEVLEPPPSSALATIETTDLVAVFTKPGGVEAILSRLEADARARAAGLDVSKEADRKAMASLARTMIARSKTTLIAKGKELTEGWRKQTAAVNADCKVIETRLDALRDEVRAPLTAFEEAEKARIAGNEAALAEIEVLAGLVGEHTAAEIAERIAKIPAITARDWREFYTRAERAITVTRERLETAHAAAVRREAEAAELARLREAEAERQRIAGHRDALNLILNLMTMPQAEPTAADYRLQIDRLERLPPRDWEEVADEAGRDIERVRGHLQARLIGAEKREAEERKAREKQIADEAAEEARQKAERLAARADYHRSMLQHVKDCGFGFIGGQPQAAGILLYELQKKIVFDEENFGDLLSEAIQARDAAILQINTAIEEGARRREEQEAAQRREQQAREQAEQAESARKAAEARAEQARKDGHARAIEAIKAKVADALSEYNTAELIRRISEGFEGMAEVHRDFQEFQDQADELIASGRRQIADRLEQVEAAEERKRQKAEKDRLAEVERQREAAAAAERQRLEAEAEAKRKEEAKRAADIEHRRKINNEAVVDLIAAGVSRTAAIEAVKAIAKGSVRHCSIKY